jgi:hypothetical protein
MESIANNGRFNNATKSRHSARKNISVYGLEVDCKIEYGTRLYDTTFFDRVANMLTPFGGIL